MNNCPNYICNNGEIKTEREKEYKIIIKRMSAYIGLSIKIYAAIAMSHKINEIISVFVMFLSHCLKARTIIINAVVNPAAVPHAQGPAQSWY